MFWIAGAKPNKGLILGGLVLFFCLVLNSAFAQTEIPIVTATSSGFHRNNNLYSASKATDNNYSTYWWGSKSRLRTDTWWLKIDTGKVSFLEQLSIWWSKEHGAANYKVQASQDGINWTNLYTNLSSAGATTNPHKVTHNLYLLARYIRIEIDQPQSLYPIIHEVKVYVGTHQLPIIKSITPLDKSTFFVGDKINIQVNVEDPYRNQLQYRYFMDNKMVKNWSNYSNFSFNADIQQRGRHAIKVEVGDSVNVVDSKSIDIYILRVFPRPEN